MVIEDLVRDSVLKVIDGMESRIASFCSELVRIQSVNPGFPGIVPEEVLGGEKECNQFLASKLEELGFKIDLFDVIPKRTNLVGTLRGKGSGRSLILNGHIDTVPFYEPNKWKWGDPISGKIEDGKVYGRGAMDMKGGIVAMISAVQAILEAGFTLKGDLLVESVIGEETMEHEAGTTATILRGYKADAAIIPEPMPDVSPMHGGWLWLNISIEGKPTHHLFRYELIRAGGRGSEVGVSAIDKGIKILNAMQELEREWGITKKHPLLPLGHSTIGPDVLRGGPKDLLIPSMIPEFCTIDYSVWYPPQFTVEEIKKEIEDYIRLISATDSWLKDHPPKVEWKLHWPPYSIPIDHPIVKTVAESYEKTHGKPARITGTVGACDAAFLTRMGIPTVIHGPGDIPAAHAYDEYVSIDDLTASTKTIALSALDWCGYST